MVLGSFMLIMLVSIGVIVLNFCRYSVWFLCMCVLLFYVVMFVCC